MDDALQKSMSRRGLLKLGAGAALVFGGGRVATAVADSGDSATNDVASTGGRSVSGPRHLRLATYVPLVGSTFRIHRSESHSLGVKLVSATRLPSDVGESFSLIFKGRGNTQLAQETYTLEHPNVGTFSLFVVPVGPARRGQSIEAVVNRIPASLMPHV